MSGSNFIHGIVLIGAMVVLGHAQTRWKDHRLHRRGARRGQCRRWLRGDRTHAGHVQAQPEARCRGEGALNVTTAQLLRWLVQVSYGRRHPVPARPAAHGLADDRTQRHPLEPAGHADRHGGDLLPARPAQRAADLAAVAIGTGVAWWSAKRVAITDMPQMVALYNGMGGGSAAAIGAVELLRFSFWPTAIPPIGARRPSPN